MNRHNESPLRIGQVFTALLPASSTGGTVRLLAEEAEGAGLIPCAPSLDYGALAALAVGSELLSGDRVLLRVTDRLLPSAADTHAEPECLTEVVTDFEAGEYRLTPRRNGFTVAWIVLSDKGAAGLRQDESGPLMAALLQESLQPVLQRGFLIPDHPGRLRALVADLALHQGYDLIVTSGGTGLAPRDTTPEALQPLIERRLPGFEQAMMTTSLAKTPRAAISRAICGTVGHSIVVTLPGSKKAVAENLEAVLPALGHALLKLQGDPADCG